MIVLCDWFVWLFCVIVLCGLCDWVRRGLCSGLCGVLSGGLGGERNGLYLWFVWCWMVGGVFVVEILRRIIQFSAELSTFLFIIHKKTLPRIITSFTYPVNPHASNLHLFIQSPSDHLVLLTQSPPLPITQSPPLPITQSPPLPITQSPPLPITQSPPPLPI